MDGCQLFCDIFCAYFHSLSFLWVSVGVVWRRPEVAVRSCAVLRQGGCGRSYDTDHVALLRRGDAGRRTESFLTLSSVQAFFHRRRVPPVTFEKNYKASPLHPFQLGAEGLLLLTFITKVESSVRS